MCTAIHCCLKVKVKLCRKSALLSIVMSYTISRRRRSLEPRETRTPNDHLFEGWRRAWKDWHQVMSPIRIDRNWEKRSGGLGFKLNPHVVSEIFGSEGPPACGIYEILASKDENKRFVVYVGSTCRSGGKSLPDRINEYCGAGSHKAALIDDALKKGYTLSFRYKVAENEIKAQYDENDLLANYSYGWNVKTVTGTLPY